ncbi:VENN motif pre-toxin domain-containing protein [Erwinia aphidicola]|uniref:VENN motif pre-toxin domain-containing protein n=1 Tax=Erwinia aphidicola TaxID=68334 RepID=UPI003016E4A5
MDVIRTQGDIAGLKAQTDPAALAQAREQLKKDDKPFRESDVLQRAYNNAMQQYGTGSDLQKAAQAVTGALTALAGNNLAGALASGASPYLATEIKKRVGEDNIAANAMAHAVLGAVTAQLNNQSAVAGGLGAGGGELAARYIAGQLFPGKTADQLSESEKQQVSALSQLAAGLAGGLATGDTGGAVTAAQAGKNAVENNALGCAGSSNPYCVGKNDLLTTGGGGSNTSGRGGSSGLVGKNSATNSLQGVKLNDYYRQAEKYGQGGVKELEDGRFRFYGTLTPAKTSGEMTGARLVREWDPKSGQTRTWYETLDHAGNIRSVAPKPVTNDKNHHIFDANGNYQGRR